MFGGIVETTGQVTKIEQAEGCLQLTLAPADKNLLADLRLGDSVAVNGVCLTVMHLLENAFQVQAVPETLALTTLGLLLEEDQVNLERALRLSDRIGGHIVQGHVDCCGEILQLDKVSGEENVLLAKIGYERGYENLLVRKGYVALDGMSITLIDVTPDWFTVTFIPHTRHHTVVKYYHPAESSILSSISWENMLENS